MGLAPGQDLWRLAVLVASAAALALVACATAEAHPPAPYGPSGDQLGGAVHRWLHEAKAPLVHGRVRVLVGDCPGAPLFVGCIFTRRPRTIFLSPRARRPRAVLYHELGHTFDLTVLHRGQRAAFKRLMGISTPGWFTSEPPAAEWFADAYTLCAERRRIGHAVAATPYGYRATPRGHAKACRLIRDAAEPKPKPRRKRRQPSDTPRVVEPKGPPSNPPGPNEPPSGPYQPPPPDTPIYVLPGCDFVEQILTGCEPDQTLAPAPQAHEGRASSLP